MMNISKNYIFGRKYNAGLLLDLFPADMAFSMYKISSSYTGNCLSVVRDSDNDDLPIGFVDGFLDVSTMLSFVGSGNGYVNRWYNQAGGNTAVQDVIANMPRIINSGVLETLNGKAALYFDGINDSFSFPNEVVTNDFSVFSYGKRFSAGSVFAPLSGSNSVALLHFSDDNYYFQVPSGYLASNSSDSTNLNYLLEAHSTTGTKYLYKNQTSVPGTFNSLALIDHFNNIGNYSGANNMKGHLSEVLLYKSNQISVKTEIGNNIIDRNS